MPAFDQTFEDTIYYSNSNNSILGNSNSFENNSSTVVSILHFNDCYNVEPRAQEPSGGAARLVTAFTALKHCNPLILFSGDIMAPSIMSTFTKGEQMVPVLNALYIDCALFGNHEFDFGVEHLESFIRRTAFPWLMSNVFDKRLDRPIACARVQHIIERNNKKFGIIGLAEEQWVSEVIDQRFEYRDFVSEGKHLAKHLKENENCDFVIALTHMRWPNDCLLAESVPEIDLILGGHDHDYQIRKINNKFCIKSGTDFRQFSKIDINFIGSGKYEIECKQISVNSFDFEEEPKLKQELEKYSIVVDSQMDLILCHINTDLDGRFASIRSKETNLGNLISDIALVVTGSEAVIFNSGMFRSDQIHPKGHFKFRDLVRILPMMDELVVLNISGRQLWRALEGAISRWPILDGRFAQISGIRYCFDPRKTVGSRIDPKSIKIGDNYLDFEKKYRLLTEEFLHKGKDGYQVLAECEVLLNDEQCPNITTLVKNYFESVAQLRAHSNNNPESNIKTLVCSSGTVTSALQSSQILDMELDLRRFEPKVDGRITCLTDE